MGKVFYDCITLSEYIESKEDVLKDFGVFWFCSKEELNELKNATTEMHADRITRKLIGRYIDDVGKVKVDKDLEDIKIEMLDLPNKTKYAFLRNKIRTTKDFVNFTNEYGWDKLKGIGEFAVSEVFKVIYPEKSKHEIDEIVCKYRKVV